MVTETEAELQHPRVLQTEAHPETVRMAELQHPRVLQTEAHHPTGHPLPIICLHPDQGRLAIEVVEDLAVEVAIVVAEAAEAVVVLVEVVAEEVAEVAEEGNWMKVISNSRRLH